jgi:hypothetical protein
MVLVLMGVSGSGNSTGALELHRPPGRPFQVGDDFHPQSKGQLVHRGLRHPGSARGQRAGLRLVPLHRVYELLTVFG